MKVLVCGAGEMSKHLIDSLNNNKDEIVNIYDPQGNGDVKDINESRDIDVIIDFSFHGLTNDIVDFAVNKKKPLLIATTGHTEEENETIKAASNYIPILKSTNTSVGVNILNEIIKFSTKLLKDFDIEVIEKHHNRKIDAPSGTANTLLNIINENLDKPKKIVYGRQGNSKREDEIGVHSIRAGNIYGEHEVIFSKGDEVIQIKHEALSRKIFADGAVRAAHQLLHKSPGMYEMKDIITK